MSTGIRLIRHSYRVLQWYYRITRRLDSAFRFARTSRFYTYIISQLYIGYRSVKVRTSDIQHLMDESYHQQEPYILQTAHRTTAYTKHGNCRSSESRSATYIPCFAIRPFIKSSPSSCAAVLVRQGRLTWVVYCLAYSADAWDALLCCI